MRCKTVALLGVLFLVGCDKKIAPPIQLDVIAPAVTKQLTDKFSDRFFKVGKIQYDAPRNCYFVEILFNDNGVEKRYVMDFHRYHEGNSQLVQYYGQFPVDLIGEGIPQGLAVFPVTIDEMMNK